MQVNVALIAMFNYFYTFQQLDPKDLSEQLKRQGASISGIRPGRQTAEFVTTTLNRMSLLGSGFLGLLAAAPAAVEAITKLQASLRASHWCPKRPISSMFGLEEAFEARGAGASC